MISSPDYQCHPDQATGLPHQSHTNLQPSYQEPELSKNCFEEGLFPLFHDYDFSAKKNRELVPISPEEQKQHNKNYLLSQRAALSNAATLKYRAASFSSGLLNELLLELRSQKEKEDCVIKILQCLTQWQKQYSEYSKQNALYILHLCQDIFSSLQIPTLKRLQFFDQYLKRFQDKCGVQILRTYLRTMQEFGVQRQLEFMKKVLKSKRFMNDSGALQITGLLSFLCNTDSENWKTYFEKALNSYDESNNNESIETQVRIELSRGQIQEAHEVAENAFQDPYIKHLLCLNQTQAQSESNKKLYSYFTFQNPMSAQIYEKLEFESQNQQISALLTKIEYSGGSLSDWQKLKQMKIANLAQILRQRETLSFWKNKLFANFHEEQIQEIRGLKEQFWGTLFKAQN